MRSSTFCFLGTALLPGSCAPVPVRDSAGNGPESAETTPLASFGFRQISRPTPVRNGETTMTAAAAQNLTLNAYMKMAGIDAGSGALSDVAGPLGNPTQINRFGRVVCVGGGLGIAPLYPIAKALAAAGNHTIGILGARSREFLFYVDRFRDVLDETLLTTDDGSLGRKGYTSDALRDVLRSNDPVDRVWLIGPPIMMKVGAETTRPFGVTTLASLNPLMLDGTGMCGGCRVDVGGQIRFACVDGPEFDAHQVDFDRLIRRLRYYHGEEAVALERFCARSRISRRANTR